MNRTRLAYLVSRYPSLSHTFILREVLSLREQGFDIRVVSINPPDRPAAELTAEEQAEAETTFCVKQAGTKALLSACLVTFLRYPIGWLLGLFFSIRLGGADLGKILYGFFYFLEALLLGRWMTAEKLNHLHVHFATPASTVGLIATKIFPISYSITVHGPDEFYDVPGYRLQEKIAGASFICAIGSFARSQLMKVSPPVQWSKFEVAPLGVDTERFAPLRAPAAGDLFEVICVGRLVPAKGQHMLIGATSRLLREGRKVRLRLVGDGPDRQSLEQQVAGQAIGASVIFEGPVNQDRIRSLYQAADLFVLPSFAEGIPVVLMEAMAMEIPVVTTFVNGIPELIRHGIDGWLVAPSDEEGLASAIATLIDDPALRRRLGQAGRLRVIDRYHLRHNTERLARIYQRRLGGIA
jgi:colanic acid/amylovoran biosynthesis glycosyltransferase